MTTSSDVILDVINENVCGIDFRNMTVFYQLTTQLSLFLREFNYY